MERWEVQRLQLRGEARVEGRGEAVKRPVLECEAVATQVQRRLPRLIAIYISRRGTCRAQHSQCMQSVTRLSITLTHRQRARRVGHSSGAASTQHAARNPTLARSRATLSRPGAYRTMTPSCAWLGLVAAGCGEGGRGRVRTNVRGWGEMRAKARVCTQTCDGGGGGRLAL